MSDPDNPVDIERLASRFIISSGASEHLRRAMSVLAKTHGVTLDEVEAGLPVTIDELTHAWVARMAKAYVDLFTEEQLRVMSDYVESPTGQLARNLAPRIAELGEQAMQQIIAEFGPAA